MTALAVILAAGCQWETPEELRLRGTPSVAIPAGEVTFDLDEVFEEILDEIVEAFRDDALGDDFTAGEVERGDPFTLFAELGIDVEFPEEKLPEKPDWFPDDADMEIEVGFADSVDDIDLSDLLGPLSEDLELVTVGGTLKVTFGGIPSEPIRARVRASWNDGKEGSKSGDIYLLGTSDSFAKFTPDDAQHDLENLTEFFNAQPSDGKIRYEFLANLADTGTVTELGLRMEVPLEVQASKTTLLALSDDDDDDGEEKDNYLVMDEDIFGRDPDDPDEDLDDLLEAIRGSSASITMVVVNEMLTATLGMTDSKDSEESKRAPDTWIFSQRLEAKEDQQDFEFEITPEDLNRMIDGKDDSRQFIPEFVILLDGGDTVSIRRGAEFKVARGVLRADVKFDQTFEF
ncbi:hypothetical protein AU468_12330 [Alkalispirochaeta sphaeroplastigenens]|uniref:Uncharacterized protein n=1 Tax=Alkalispirochaeta sphaeroplastigenens TaxID=1187066 RepID=A0A2S4JH65_9SPIO|nr:hypothetical protein AU468_12330 [Alkalispirochaeta sphaeroplastigenens]